MGIYIKYFDRWNEIKKQLDTGIKQITFYEKEIWWCNLGVNVGSEQDGKGDSFLRPVYVLKIINSNTFIAIPLTSKLKQDESHMSFYFNYSFHTAIISQIKVLDKRRLLNRLGIVSDYMHLRMKKATYTFMVN